MAAEKKSSPRVVSVPSTAKRGVDREASGSGNRNPGAKSRNGPRTPPKVYKAMPNFLIPNLTGIKPYVYYSMANLLCREADVYESLKSEWDDLPYAATHLP